MNYFELFDIPVSFTLDESVLISHYYKLSRQWHPDRFTLGTPAEQSQAIQMTTDINEGYKVLKQNQSRIHHILQLLGAAPEEGKESMPQEFLMEMMDINETIMELKMDPTEAAKASVNIQIEEIQAGLVGDFEEAIDGFEFQAPDPEKLAGIKDYYLKSKYLRRLQDNVQDREVEM